MVFHLIKAEKSSFVQFTVHLSLQFLSLLCFSSFPSKMPFFFFKETNQAKQTQACLGGSAISSYFMLTAGAGENVLVMAKVILGRSSPLFLPNLKLSSDVLWFGDERL